MTTFYTQNLVTTRLAACHKIICAPLTFVQPSVMTAAWPVKHVRRREGKEKEKRLCFQAAMKVRHCSRTWSRDERGLGAVISQIRPLVSAALRRIGLPRQNAKCQGQGANLELRTRDGEEAEVRKHSLRTISSVILQIVSP